MKASVLLLVVCLVSDSHHVPLVLLDGGIPVNIKPIVIASQLIKLRGFPLHLIELMTKRYHLVFPIKEAENFLVPIFYLS